MAQSVKRPTSAQVMISRSVSSSPASGSVLTAQSLKPVSDSVSPSFSAPPLLMLCLSLSKINITKKKKIDLCLKIVKEQYLRVICVRICRLPDNIERRISSDSHQSEDIIIPTLQMKLRKLPKVIKL